MRNNKKAWLRIVEATIGILLVASVLFVMVARIPRESNSENIYKLQRFTLEQVSKNDLLRKEILDDTITPKIQTENFIRNMLPVHWEFAIRVCTVDEVCGMNNYPDKKEIYGDEILITSTLTEYKPKKLKLFIWAK